MPHNGNININRPQSAVFLTALHTTSETGNDPLLKKQCNDMKEQVKRWINAQRKENKDQKLQYNDKERMRILKIDKKEIRKFNESNVASKAVQTLTTFAENNNTKLCQSDFITTD